MTEHTHRGKFRTWLRARREESARRFDAAEEEDLNGMLEQIHTIHSLDVDTTIELPPPSVPIQVLITCINLFQVQLHPPIPDVPLAEETPIFDSIVCSAEDGSQCIKVKSKHREHMTWVPKPNWFDNNFHIWWTKSGTV